MNRNIKRRLFVADTKAFILSALFCLLFQSLWAASVQMNVEVDAREISRKLLHSRIELPVKQGELILWYPKWIPGIHAPRSPIENIGGLRIESAAGESIPWQRDKSERFRFICNIPKGVKKIVIYLDYICNQPSTNSRGIDSFASSTIGVINWNTCLLYPDGYSSEEVLIDLKLQIPDGWKWGSSLQEITARSDEIQFENISLHDLVDSPIIFGKHFRKFPLNVNEIPPVTLHVSSESGAGLAIPDEIIKHYGNIATEAGILLGGAHFKSYQWLVFCSDELPNLGLEHLLSSLNGVGERDLIKMEDLQGWVGTLLPHEMIHSWCGKFRRPAGMDTPNFHSNKETQALWVYEGLTQYLSRLITVRGGLWTLDHYKQKLALTISRYLHQEGRQWRSLEDTAIDSYHLRGGSRSWVNLRRNQDYYNEGLMFWLEVDTIIRIESDGTYNLDDFCKEFLGAGYPDQDTLPFETEDIIQILEGLADYDWRGLINKRIRETQERLPLEFVDRLGYRLQYANERSKALEKLEKDDEFASAMDSIGMTVNEEGKVASSVVPGMPVDESGIAPGMKIIGVNGRKFSLDRFREAIADSVVNEQIEFLVLDGESFSTYEVKYADGPKYLELVRDPSKPDLLSQIFKPLRPMPKNLSAQNEK